MKKTIYYLSILFLFANCNNAIKDETAKVEEETGTEVITEVIDTPETTSEQIFEEVHDYSGPYAELIGYWVGDFVPAKEEDQDEKTIYADEGFTWGRQNKINISIDKIEGKKVTGHSVVAGNSRPFEGTMEHNPAAINGSYYFEVKEPGDDKYDGTFMFTIDGDELKGTWKAYKKIDIQERKYTLGKKEFKYNPDVMLERRGPFVNWEKFKTEIRQYDEEYSEEYKEFETATDAIYEINASNKLLTKKDVENLKKGDLIIIRNTIYVRHGYSFKKRPLRVFFDEQSWYIPLYNNIKTNLTDIEKKNIELLLRYEKNAKEYYDSFGRG